MMRMFGLYLLFVLLPHMLHAVTLENKYPSYSYVFNEFDVDESYLYDDDFIDFVKKHEHKLNSFYRRSLTRGEALLPMIQGQLLEEGVSDLFLYLSMIESGFSTTIVSPKKAVGLWQFMPATAKHYGLKVCSSYDERCDAISATRAAIRYLNKLHREFGKWYLAAMAYNCGEGRVRRAIKKAGSDALDVLANSRSNYLPRETKDYIKKILLIAMIGESSLIGLDDATESENGTVEVEVDRDTSIGKIATLIKMDKKSLLKLNPAYINGKIPKNRAYYTLTIPIEKIYAFYLRYTPPEDLFETQIKETKSHMITHSVKLGETLESIAKKYEADADEIRVANHLDDPYLLVNSLLVIPVTQKIFEKHSRQ